MSEGKQERKAWEIIGETHFEGEGDFLLISPAFPANEDIVAFVPVEAEDHARLIAAAPDLLEALKALMEQPTANPLTRTPEQRKELWAAHGQARAAIAKAEGRTE